MKNKFQTIESWIPLILEAIKKEIRTDHLASSPAFVRAHFGHRPLNRITTEELFAAYTKELLAGNEDLGDWVVNRWVFKHGDIYQHFAERLSEVHPDFGSIESLDLAQSEKVLQGAPEAFGALPVYLFCFLNGVVFPQEVFSRLEQAAIKEESAKKEIQKKEEEQKNFEEILTRKERELLSAHKKYEEKIAGVMKKYTVDTEGLKKQIRSLQQQLHKLKV
jgi:hypothetical protein